MTALGASLRGALVQLSDGRSAGQLRARLLHWRDWAAQEWKLSRAVAYRLMWRYQGAVIEAWRAWLVCAQVKRAKAAAAQTYSAHHIKAKVLSTLLHACEALAQSLPLYRKSWET